MRGRYEVADLIKLRDSPLSQTCPPSLPPKEEWMGYALIFRDQTSKLTRAPAQLIQRLGFKQHERMKKPSDNQTVSRSVRPYLSPDDLQLVRQYISKVQV